MIYVFVYYTILLFPILLFSSVQPRKYTHTYQLSLCHCQVKVWLFMRTVAGFF